MDTVKKLWEKMLPDDDRHAQIAKDIADVVGSSSAVVVDLERALRILSGMTDIEEFVAEFETMQSELPVLRSEINTLKAEMEKKNRAIARLTELHTKMAELGDEDDVADPPKLTESLDLCDQIKRKIDKAVLASGRKAVVRQELTGELRDANEEIERLKKVVESLQDASAPLLRDIEHLKKLMADTRKELDASHKACKLTDERNANLAKQIEMLQRQLSEVSSTKDSVIDRQKDEISEHVRAIRELRDNSATAAQNAAAEIADLSEQLKELKRGLADETATVIELQRKLAQSKHEETNQRQKTDSQRGELQAQIEVLKQKLAEAVARADDEERGKRTHIAQLDLAQGTITEKHETIQEHKAALAARDKEVKDIKALCDSQVESLESKLIRAQREVDEGKQQMATATEHLRLEIDELKKKIASALARADAEEREKKRWFDEHGHLQQVISAKDLEIEELKKRITELNKQLQDALDQLAKGGTGMADLLKEIEILKSALAALQHTFDGEKEKFQKQKEKYEATVVAKDFKILDCQKQLADRDRTIQNTKPVLDAEIAKVQDKEKEIAARDKTIASKDVEKKDVSKLLAAAELKIKSVEASYEKALGVLRDDMDAGKLREVALKRELEVLRKELVLAKKELDVSLKQLDKVKKDLQTEIAEMRVQFVDATARADSEETLKKHWIAQKYATDDVVTTHEKEIGELKKIIAQHSKVVADLKNAALVQDKKIEDLSKQIALLQVQAETANKHRKRLEAEIEELKKHQQKEMENHNIKVLPLDSQIAELR